MMKESVALLEEQLQSARAGDARRRELERRVASLQAELIAKDRALRSQYQHTLLPCLWPLCTQMAFRMFSMSECDTTHLD